MPTYLLAYHGSRIPTADERSESSSAWKAWMDKLGDALEGSNNPMKITKTISADGSVSAGGSRWLELHNRQRHSMPATRGRGGLDRSRRTYPQIHRLTGLDDES